MDDRSVLNVLVMELVSKIYSLDQCWLNTYCVPGTVVGAFMKLLSYRRSLSEGLLFPPPSVISHQWSTVALGAHSHPGAGVPVSQAGTGAAQPRPYLKGLSPPRGEVAVLQLFRYSSRSTFFFLRGAGT